MSIAHECDRCGHKYKETVGTSQLDFSIGLADQEGSFQGWSDIDLCVECTKKVAAILKPACQDFDEVAPGEKA